MNLWFLVTLFPTPNVIENNGFSQPRELYVRELGIGIVAYCPVGRGLFAGKKAVESLPQDSSLVYSVPNCVNPL